MQQLRDVIGLLFGHAAQVVANEFECASGHFAHHGVLGVAVGSDGADFDLGIVER